MMVHACKRSTWQTRTTPMSSRAAGVHVSQIEKLNKGPRVLPGLITRFDRYAVGLASGFDGMDLVGGERRVMYTYIALQQQWELVYCMTSGGWMACLHPGPLQKMSFSRQAGQACRL